MSAADQSRLSARASEGGLDIVAGRVVSPAAAGLPAEAIARVVHEANRAVQVEQADPTIGVGPHWDDLDDETKGSALDGVRAIIEHGLTPEQSHENWVRFKLLHGWRWGPVKDEATRRHPLLVSYADLPESQRVKDDLFAAIVGALR